MSSLAGSFPPDAKALPRGRGRIDPEQVSEAQRARLLRAAISAFAERGFAATTVGDIVTRARVARAAFYRQFPDQQACFIAAVDAGQAAVLPKVAEAAAHAAPDGFAATIRAAVREYLRVSAAEPEFTRAWTLEFPGAGPAALARRHEYFDTLAGTLSAIHSRFGHPTHQTSDPKTDTLYIALIGGCHELFYRYVSAARTLDGLPDLEEPVVRFLLNGMR